MTAACRTRALYHAFMQVSTRPVPLILGSKPLLRLTRQMLALLKVLEERWNDRVGVVHFEKLAQNLSSGIHQGRDIGVSDRSGWLEGWLLESLNWKSREDQHRDDAIPVSYETKVPSRTGSLYIAAYSSIDSPLELNAAPYVKAWN